MIAKWWKWAVAIAVAVIALFRIRRGGVTRTLVETQKEIQTASGAKSDAEIKSAVADHQDQVENIKTVEEKIDDSTLQDLATLASEEFR